MTLRFRRQRSILDDVRPTAAPFEPPAPVDGAAGVEVDGGGSSSLDSRAGEMPRSLIAPVALLAAVLAVGVALAVWKQSSMAAAAAAAAQQPEPMEFVTTASARPHVHHPTTTSIGTVLARRSISLRNELPGTVRWVQLTPGRIVEAGSVLVRLDVSVEEAELEALRAQAALAQTLLDRNEQAIQKRAVAELEVDRARAERDVALAQIARLEAIIERKTIRAPFRARVGLADLHPGQYLDAGTELTTLQGIDRVAHVDFSVTQEVAARLREGDVVEVLAGAGESPLPGRIVAIDARIDPDTRNAMVRAEIEGGDASPAPGASVRVRVPAGPPQAGVVIPVSALRTGPDGDHVFVIAHDESGSPRARLRRVSTGAVLDDRVVIQAGLASGEEVAASGSFKLREAVLVAVDSGTTAGASAGSK